ncbi:hypothetical protein O6H91_10G028400 [Diphasiastrum complanatum]|uniref:Uncharacterized protein n=3 Tax=Diphasiastrum complanatum TaxID=34168 RepID=A0ACC2CFD9_DIPCM|nr:hypothetical protein O6H91_10G028400 [Diphasiastrum complanatum]
MSSSSRQSSQSQWKIRAKDKVDINPPHISESSQNSEREFSRKSSNGAATRIDHVSEAISEQDFVPYLAQDEEGIDIAETQEVVDLLNKKLRSLLRLKFKDFWQQVANNRSLQEFLDSYLHFRRRWHDKPLSKATGAIDGVIVGDGDLSRRVFMILYRISLNQEPGAINNERLSFDEHSGLLRKHRLLDIAKLMDICALYGHDNPELTHKLVSNAIKSQPDFQHQVTEMVPQILKTISTMHRRSCGTVQIITDSSNKEAMMNEKLYQELFEVVEYLHDVVATLDAFTHAYPPAASILTSKSSEGLQGSILSSMAAVHDLFSPILHNGLSVLIHLGGMKDQSSFSYSSKKGDIIFPAEMQLKRLQVRLVKFVWNLLSFSFLDGQERRNEAESKTIDNPAERGNQLVQAIVSLADAEASEGDSLTKLRSLESSNLPMTNGSLLRNIQARYHLCEEISGLREKGTISIDDIQYDYLLTLVTNRDLPYAEKIKDVPSMSGLSIKDQAEKDEQAVIHQSQISQIKDLFPEYGDGFIAACLEVYDSDPEMVIQKILEGVLHPDLLALDTKLEKKTINAAALPDKRDKGKGKFFEENSSSLTEPKSGVQDKHQSSSIAGAAHAATFASEKTASSEEAVSSESNSSLVGRFVRREKGDANAVKLLDTKDVNVSILTAALASRLTYEDEYDDSFDDLDMHIADAGVEETETLADLVLHSNRQRHNENDNLTSKINGDTLKGRGLLDRPQSDERSGGSSMRNISQAVTRDVPKVSPRVGTGWDHAFSGKSSTGNVIGSKQSGPGKYKGKAKEQNTSRFYVKDGKNYSYKVAGAVAAVSSVEEAEAFKKEEEEMIYGLGAGGNVPWREPATTASPKDRGYVDDNAHLEKERVSPESASMISLRGSDRGAETRANAQSSRHNHHRKDRALKKHFSGLGGN